MQQFFRRRVWRRIFSILSPGLLFLLPGEFLPLMLDNDKRTEIVFSANQLFNSYLSPLRSARLARRKNQGGGAETWFLQYHGIGKNGAFGDAKTMISKRCFERT